MAGFKQAREELLVAFCDNVIDAETFVMLYDINKSKNFDYPYETYDSFDLDNVSDDECRSEFRFYKNDIFLLAEALNIPEVLTCYNGSKVGGIEGLCIFLKRFCYPCRYSDMIPRFARPVPQLCMVSNTVMNFIHENFHHLLETFNQPWLSQIELVNLAGAIHARGAPLQNCWGFVDGTVRPVCRPHDHQRILYNGHKRVHSIKFQSVVTPNGLIANLAGPYEGRKHDSGMLADSGLLLQLQAHSFSPAGDPLCIYGDQAYPLRVHLQGPFRRNAAMTPDQVLYNKAMSQVRTSVEWVFGDITNYFAFLDFKKNLKVGLSAVGKMYICCALMRNAHTCIYKNTTSIYFGVDPPNILQYFQ